MKELNYIFFLWINATLNTPQWILILATIIAKYFIFIPCFIIFFPLRLLCCFSKRKLILKITFALIISLVMSWLNGIIFPTQRPFVLNIGHKFIDHQEDNSYPSDHGVVIFTFAFSFFTWGYFFLGIISIIIGALIAWSRVFLGIHWPLDMIGSILIAIIASAVSKLIWIRYISIILKKYF